MVKYFLKLKKWIIIIIFQHFLIKISDTEKAFLLNIYFCQQSTVNKFNKNPIQTSTPPIANRPYITIFSQYVIDDLSNVDLSNACGPDYASPRLFKKASHELSSPLYTFFTILLSKSYFPKNCKRRKRIPIFFYKADPSNPQQLHTYISS